MGEVTALPPWSLAMRITCPHCSHPIEVGDDATPELVPGPPESTTVLEPPRPPAPARAQPRQRIGKLELLERVGAGAFAEVWKARDTELGRLVAVKIPYARRLLTPQDEERFVREGRSAANLSHPGIVAVHEAGYHEGMPYLVTQFIDGPTLAALRARRALEFREAAVVVAQVADALAYAHTRGVVHRDVKPSNIMLARPEPSANGAGGEASPGQALLADFGLALCQGGDETLTQEGQVMGTPSYMSPELAGGQGHSVDGRSDIYSLGVVLYQLLAGEVPFRGSGRMVLEQVLHEEPRPPRRLNDRIPPDLQTITLKCLAKGPGQRYQTAAELADDLKRWLAGEPIRARPTGPAERLGRWARRNRAVAVLAASLAVLLLTAAVGGTAAAVWLRQVAADTEGARREEAAARRGAETALADLHTSRGVMAGEQGRPAEAVLWFAHAARLARHDPERERDNRVRVRTWAREAPLPLHAFAHHEQELLQIDFHPGGRHLLTLSRQGRAVIWDLDQDCPLPWPGDAAVSAAAWGPDGAWLALALPAGEVEIRGFPCGDLVERLPHRGPCRALAVSAGGRFLALGGDSVRVWDCRARAFATGELAHPAAVVALAFNTRGDRLATGCLDGRARVFAVPGGPAASAPLFPPVPHVAEGRLAAVAPAPLLHHMAPVFVANDRGLLTTTPQEGVTWRDAETGQAVRPVPLAEGEPQVVLAGPGAAHFVVGGYGGARLWDAARGEPEGAPLPSRNFVTAAAFSRDGTTLLTVAGDRTAQLWSVPGGQPLGPPLRHHAILTLAAYSADGRLLATAQADGLVRVWAPPPGNEGDQRLSLSGAPTFARLGPDGHRVIATGAGWRREGLSATRVFDVATGRPAGPPLEGDGALTDAALSPDGRCAATLHSAAVTDSDRFGPLVEPDGRAGCLLLWDWPTARRLCDPVPMPSEPRGVAYSPDGRQVVVICGGGQVLVIDSARAAVVLRSQHGFERSSYNTYPSVRFLPGGDGFVTWGPDTAVRVWDAKTGELRCEPLRHEGLVQDAVPSPDGRFLVTAGRDATARVWDLATGRPAAEPLRHPDWVFSACFSPDGGQVLTACRDGMARLVDWRSGRPACPPFRHADEVFGAALTPDGRRAITTGRDRTARVWEWHTGRPLTPPRPLGGWGWSTLIGCDGEYAVVAGQRPALAVLDLRDLADTDGPDLDDLCLLGEVLAGEKIQDGSEVAALTTDEWLERWRAFRQRHPYPAVLAPPEAAAWHRRQAEAFEAAGQWAAALWHLDRLIAARPEDWTAYHRQGLAHAARGEPDQAAADCTRAVEHGADDWEVWLDRAQARAAASRWDEAAADYARAVEMGATSGRVLSQHALLRLATGDAKGYRQVCATMLARFGNTGSAKIANNVAWVCGYAPDAVEDLPRVVRLAEEVAGRHPKKYATLNTLGAVLYRAGRYEDAVRRLEEAIKAHPRGGAPFDFLFLAMAHQRLGHGEEARRWLARATEWAERAERGQLSDPTIQLPLFWIQRLELRLLRAEAAACVGHFAGPPLGARKTR
jgi:WD40 repeat protein/tetratricopeptide (TPR) repeat protein/tRNA A-37 threonylcarbamoyl transferase component Bud32